MTSNTILAGIGATLLALALFASGFLLCCMPVTTQLLSQKYSAGTSSPYTHEQLVSLAEATHAFTVGSFTQIGDGTAEGARTALSQSIVEAATEASTEAAKSGEWSERALEVVQSDATATEKTSELAAISDRYALDEDALAHLEDCRRLISGVFSWVVMLAAATAAVIIILVARKQFAGLAFMFRMGPCFIALLLAMLGIWGLVDFNSLFAVFHSFFFESGSWVFNADSLLISMYPTGFWVGMGVTWFAVSIALSLLAFALGSVFAWRADVARDVYEAQEAQARMKKGKKKRSA